MADVRRPATWENLGFACDPATGAWTETGVRASQHRGLTWEGLGFVQDRSGHWTESEPLDLYLLRDPCTGGWIEGGQKAAGELLAARGHKFDPHQPRDPGGEDGGQWVSSPASAVGGAIKDALKLAEKIHLGEGETFLGSAKVNGDVGGVRIAVIDAGGRRRIRFGVGGDDFDTRDDPAGRWTGDPSPSLDSVNAERRRNAAEQAALLAERPHADPARQEAIEARLDELYEAGTSEVTPAGHTADIAAGDLARFRVAVPEAVAKALADRADEEEWQAERDELVAAMRRIRFLPGREGESPRRSPENQARWDALKAQLDALDADPPSVEMNHVYVEGRIPGDHATVHYRVESEDTEAGVQVRLGAVPHDSPITGLDDLGAEDMVAILTPGDFGNLARVLDKALPPVG